MLFLLIMKYEKYLFKLKYLIKYLFNNIYLNNHFVYTCSDVIYEKQTCSNPKFINVFWNLTLLYVKKYIYYENYAFFLIPFITWHV